MSVMIPDAHLPFSKGDQVLLIDLKANHLNGIHGRVLHFDRQCKRFAVLIATGKKILVKPKNLSCLSSVLLFQSQEKEHISRLISDPTPDFLLKLKDILLNFQGQPNPKNDPTIARMNDRMHACFISKWASQMSRIYSDDAEREIVSIIEHVMETLEFPGAKVALTICLAKALDRLGDSNRAIELLENCIDQHYGQFPRVAATLFKHYNIFGLFGNPQKIIGLFEQGNGLIEEGLYDERCNASFFYKAFADSICMIYFIEDGTLCKLEQEILNTVEMAIEKCELLCNSREKEGLNDIKALLEFYNKNFDACIEYIDAHCKFALQRYGREVYHFVDFLRLRFECYLAKADYTNGRYYLDKWKKFANPDERTAQLLEKRLGKIDRSQKRKKEKLRGKTRCANPFCFKVEKTEGDFQCCGNCRIPVYCSRKCQKVHWKRGHKKVCRKN